MLSSMKSTDASSSFFVHFQQVFQDWVRRIIIDDDPYDPLTIEDLEEETGVPAVETAELV